MAALVRAGGAWVASRRTIRETIANGHACSNGTAADEPIVVDEFSWFCVLFHTGAEFPFQFAGSFVQAIGKAIVATKVNAVVSDGGGKSDRAVGDKGPARFASDEIQRD